MVPVLARHLSSKLAQHMKISSGPWSFILTRDLISFGSVIASIAVSLVASIAEARPVHYTINSLAPVVNSDSRLFHLLLYMYTPTGHCERSEAIRSPLVILEGAQRLKDIRAAWHLPPQTLLPTHPQVILAKARI
jgi:hypothetical protein